METLKLGHFSGLETDFIREEKCGCKSVLFASFILFICVPRRGGGGSFIKLTTEKGSLMIFLSAKIILFLFFCFQATPQFSIILLFHCALVDWPNLVGLVVLSFMNCLILHSSLLHLLVPFYIMSCPPRHSRGSRLTNKNQMIYKENVLTLKKSGK